MKNIYLSFNVHVYLFSGREDLNQAAPYLTSKLDMSSVLQALNIVPAMTCCNFLSKFSLLFIYICDVKLTFDLQSLLQTFHGSTVAFLHLGLG